MLEPSALRAKHARLSCLCKVFVMSWVVPLLLIRCGNGPSPLSLVTPSPAPWSTQLDVAKKAAAQYDPDAVLTRVHANRAAPTDAMSITQTGALVVDFFFYSPRSSGKVFGSEQAKSEIKVTLQDTDPEATVQVLPDYQYISPPLSVKEQHRYNQAAATVAIGPREALERTIADGIAFGSRQNSPLDLQVTLDLKESVRTNYGIPAVWSVAYLTLGDHDLFVVVNAHDGAIVRNFEK